MYPAPEIFYGYDYDGGFWYELVAFDLCGGSLNFTDRFLLTITWLA